MALYIGRRVGLRANTSVDGAAEHVAKHFAQWCRRIARAVRRHKESDTTREAPCTG